MSTALPVTRRLADRDPLVGLLGWKAVLLYADPCTYDRWRWVQRFSAGGPVRTMDAGSGNGAFAMFAASIGNEATALSYSADDQAKAERRAAAVGLTGIRFPVGDLRELDRFAGELGHVRPGLLPGGHRAHPRRRQAPARPRERHPPRGPAAPDDPAADHRPFYGETISGHEDGHHVRVGYTPDEMEALLAEAGFADVTHRRVSGIVSQAGFNLMYRLNRVYPHLGWIASAAPAAPAAAGRTAHPAHRVPAPVHRGGRGPQVSATPPRRRLPGASSGACWRAGSCARASSRTSSPG